jgi:hypothetical protein
MVKTHEITPVVARECLLPKRFEERKGNAHRLQAALTILLRTRDLFKLLGPKDWGKLVRTATCFEELAYFGFFLEYLGFKLQKIPRAPFCAMHLYILMVEKRENSADWKRELMTTWVVEDKRTETLTPLVVSLTLEDSQEYWAKVLRQQLSLPNFPTEAQADELKSTMKIMQSKHDGEMAPVVAEAADFVQSGGGGKSANKVLTFLVVAETIEFMRVQGKTPEGQEKAAAQREGISKSLCALLQDPNTVAGALALYNGIELEKLKEGTGWKLAKPLPMSMRRVLMGSLAEMSWLKLFDILKKKPGLWKAVLRSVHMGSMLKKALKQHAKDAKEGGKPKDQRVQKQGVQKVCLLVRLLHGAKYPLRADGADDGDTSMDWADWVQWVVEPLEAMLRDPLFEMQEGAQGDAQVWLSREWNASLAGCTMPMPRRRSVEVQLAVHGSSSRTWKKLLEGGQMTLPQLLFNARSMVMLNVPMRPVASALQFHIGRQAQQLEQQLLEQLQQAAEAKAKQETAAVQGTMVQSWVALLRSIVALRASLGDEKLQELAAKMKEANITAPATAIETEAVDGKVEMELVAEEELDEDAIDALEPRLPVTVVVKDKKGAPQEKLKHKRVASIFADPVAAAALVRQWSATGGLGLLGALEDAISAQVQAQAKAHLQMKVAEGTTVSAGDVRAAVLAKRAKTLAMIVYTPELCDAIRVGMPPVIPEYTKVSLWRGEGVCLQRLIGRLAERDGERKKVMEARAAKGRVAVSAMLGGGHAGAVDSALAAETADDELAMEVEPTKSTVDPRPAPGAPPQSHELPMLQGLLVGISWCEAKGSDRGVDLDLSLLLFDESFEFIAHCSYQNLRLPGATHSGDLTSAPFPRGARETVELDMPALRKAHPTCKYAALMVYAYSGQSMDELGDASVFVANANSSGSGPGGTDILSAAKLTGKGTANLCGYVEIEQLEEVGMRGTDEWIGSQLRYHFVCVDQTLNVQSRSATDGTGIGDAVRRAAQMGPRGDKCLSPKLGTVATLMASTVADRVLVLHGNDQRSLVCREKDESMTGMMVRIEELLATCTPTLEPRPTCVGASDWGTNPMPTDPTMVVFGGELDDYAALAREFGRSSHGYVSRGDLRLVNLRSGHRRAERSEEATGELVVEGWEVLNYLLEE